MPFTSQYLFLYLSVFTLLNLMSTTLWIYVTAIYIEYVVRWNLKVPNRKLRDFKVCSVYVFSLLKMRLISGDEMFLSCYSLCLCVWLIKNLHFDYPIKLFIVYLCNFETLPIFTFYNNFFSRQTVIQKKRYLWTTLFWLSVFVLFSHKCQFWSLNFFTRFFGFFLNSCASNHV